MKELKRWCSKWTSATIVAAVSFASATQAYAGGFDERGVFSFDPAAIASLDFEQELDASRWSGEEGDMMPTRTATESALSGEWTITVDAWKRAHFPVPLVEDVAAYRVSMWLRNRDALAYVVTTQKGSKAVRELGVLYPTGRVTSDGWVELGNEEIRADGAHSDMMVGVFAPAGVEFDAVEVVPQESNFTVLNQACAGVSDANSCGPGQVCYWSQCRNVNAWVPPIPSERSDVTSYLENRLKFLFGPYLQRSQDLPKALLAIEQMRHADDAWSYWNSFTLAIRRLHDGHTTTSGAADYTVKNPKPISVCFVEGEADLSQANEPSHAVYRDVLVSHTGADHNLGFKAGDRLVRVDGMHPIAWSRSLIEVDWAQPVVSNPRTFAEHAANLRRQISRFAQEIEVIRCDKTTQTCGAVETLLMSEVPASAEESVVDWVSCDNRPLRHLSDSPADHDGSNEVFVGLLKESNPSEKIYGVEWDSLYTTNGQDGIGAALSDAITVLRSEVPQGVIFDHRRGTGGTLAGPKIIWNYAVERKPLSFTQERQRAEDTQPNEEEGKAVYQAGLSAGEVLYAGSNQSTSIPIALLLTADVSASDWLPLGMKGAANVRVFGPYETNGAFSTRLQFGYWFGVNFVMATGDTFLSDGSTRAGTGVAPDVVVLPKQSDLLEGKDSVHQAALEWIRQEIAP